ncbi:AAA family ATPase [Pseudosulfitobacter pseudonitzschiae]|uniref:AAA family ATPase n=1 Tax=Pseudosulfitobacter pseudonitzschiae TaxID=1402135 RepID=UPI001AF796E1|nr:AAA family ATPase [Pseudosulfitobacter pseudonitzschiae]MBM1815171.1 AAA family ATPase [Pseudosulfitobacter pseudonitzschiae]MBM1832162.1 AAA family ATPase [Pseudosulfitobacter pseudonitzschiae]MBM1837030.1 AAA family ATPase [Pseudosulfitobacter pseudonitzschiae]MBM1841876.1 AAA family ATPase [Pseudosulfitobacter pseudonitzschiae]MBM1846744.1 AAA family ATPase [Pseudosulfitobacter pseudonitzschiae]
MSSVMPQPETAPIVACTVSRDVQNFDLLIEDMETTLGEAWGDLGFVEALAFFGQPEAEALEFIALAMDQEDEEDLVLMSEVITQAKARKIKVILIAEDVTPASLHSLLRQGADEFIPYPLPEGELKLAIQRIQAPSEPEKIESNTPALRAGTSKDGAVIVVHGIAGGTGATTLATNLAWELAILNKKGETAPSVCLLDLDLQFGSVSTYLDLARREAVYEMMSDTENMDDETFGQSLLTFNEKLHVLTAPADMLPLDLVTPEDISRVIEMARSHFDYVVVDMPSTLVQWTETVLHAAHIYFVTLEQDMRSAQNTLRFKRALMSEELPTEKLRYVLNRAPKFTDISGKGRVKRMAESLEVAIEVSLPDGGKPITQGADHGLPLAASAPKNPLRREIAKLAASIHETKSDQAKAA